MVVLLDCCHPADVHFLRAIANCLEEEGRAVHFTARPKDVVLPLLNEFDIDYTLLGTHYSGKFGKALGLAFRSLALARLAKRIKAEVLVGHCNPYVAQAARWKRMPSLVTTDTDTGHAQNRFLHPATVILTPEWFGPLARPHHCHLAGRWFKELAYMRDFTTDELATRDLKEPYIIVRTVGWTAAHDRGYGIQLEPELLVEQMGSNYTIYHSHEGPYDGAGEVKIDELPMASHLIHHALSRASLVVTEGATMAAEAALAGRPTIYLNPLKPAYLSELERVGLLSIAANAEHALDLASSHLQGTQGKVEDRMEVAREYVASCWPIERYVAELVGALAGKGTDDVVEVHQRYVKGQD